MKTIAHIFLTCSLLFFGDTQIGFTQVPAHQLPPNQSEQHPCGAIEFCADSLDVRVAYDSNVFWLKIEIAQAGEIALQMRQYSDKDEYKLTIFGPAINCDNTGIAIRRLKQINNTGPPIQELNNSFLETINRRLPVQAGETYFIRVYGRGEPVFVPHSPFPAYYKTPYGCKIDFTGTTATFLKNSPPVMRNIDVLCTNKGSITLELDRDIQCSSVANDGSDFYISPTNASNVLTAAGKDCFLTQHNYSDKIRLWFDQHLSPGTYTLHLQRGSDGNTLLDLCGEEMPIPASITFTVPDLDDTVNITVCPQQMPYTWNGTIVNNPGNLVASVHNPTALGCDSVTFLNLIVRDTLRDTVSMYVCPDEFPFSWNGISISAPGNYVGRYHTQTAAGCDSVVLLNVFSISSQLKDTTVHACGSFTYKGVTYTQSSLIQDTIKSDYGCDSLYLHVNLMLYPELIPVTSQIDTQGCGFVIFEDRVYTGDSIWTDTLWNVAGCDSVYRHIQVTVYPNAQPQRHYDTVSNCGEVLFEDQVYTWDTIVSSVYTNIAGCDSAEMITFIRVNRLNLAIIAEPEQPVIGDYLQLRTRAAEPYRVIRWEPVDLFPNQTAMRQTIQVQRPETYRVIGRNDQNCLDTAEWSMIPDTLVPEVVIPNAFSPNGDGLNDYFSPNFINQSGHLIKDFKVFNRWGQMIYQKPTTKQLRWDGRGPDGTPFPTDVYYYSILIEFVDGKSIKKNGEIHLIR